MRQPPPVQLSLAEQIIYLSPLEEKSSACQLRGVVTLAIPAPRGVTLTFRGLSVWVDWDTNPKEPRNRQQESKHTVHLDVAEIGEAPTTTTTTTTTTKIPFSFPVPPHLPPSVDADFGSNTYALIATVEGEKPGSKPYEAQVPVRFVHEEAQVAAGDASVEGLVCKDRVSFRWYADPSTFCSTKFGMTLALNDLGDSTSLAEEVAKRVSLRFLQVVLEEYTSYGPFESPQTPVKRQWTLLKLGSNECTIDDDILQKASRLAVQRDRVKRTCNKANEKGSDRGETTEHEEEEEEGREVEDANRLAWDLQIPGCAKTPINNSIHHIHSAVKVTHRLVLRFSLLQESSRLYFDDKNPMMVNEVKKPIWLQSSFLAEPGTQLPCYYCAHQVDHPYNVESQYRQVNAQTPSTSPAKLPEWITRLWSSSKRRTESEEETNKKEEAGGKLWFALSSGDDDPDDPPPNVFAPPPPPSDLPV